MTSTTNYSNASMIAKLESRGYDILAQNFANDKTGLFYKTYTIGKGNLTPHEADGVYLLLGADSKTIENITYDDSTVLEEYKKQDCNSAMVYPRCSIVKFDNKISSYSEFIDLRNRLDLVNLIFSKFRLDPPEEFAMRDFITLFELYEQWAEQEDPSLKRDIGRQVEYIARLIASGKTREEYEKENGTVSVGDEKIYKALMKKNDERLKPSIYESDKTKCLEMHQILRHGKDVVAMNVKEEYLPAIERDLELIPDMEYSIVKESVPTFTDEGLVHWHMLAFPTSYRSNVSAIVHKHELGLEDRAKSYYSGDLETAYSIPISTNDFEQFAKYFKEINLDFHLDMNGTYQVSDIQSVGIVVEDAESYRKMLNVVKILLDSKMRGTLISDEDEKHCEYLKGMTLQILEIDNNQKGYAVPYENNLIKNSEMEK